MIKRILILSLVLLFMVSAGAYAAKQELLYVVNNEAELYDPGISAETFAAATILNTFEGLVKLDKVGQVVPAAAQSWDISKDGLTYTFKIKKNAKWSDGKDLTANDFAYSWKRVLNPKTGAKYTDMLFYIKNAKLYFEGKAKEEDLGIKVIDKKTIQLTLENVTPYMLQQMTFWVYCPVRSDMVEKDPEGWSRKPETYIGNGPFKVSEMNFGKSTVFVKNKYYHKADKVKLQKFTTRVIPELSTALAAMEAGDVDGIEAVPSAEIPRLAIESKEFVIVPALGTTFANFNCTKEPLDDPKVRRALAMAINRREIIDHVLQSADSPAMALVPYGLGLGGKDFREEGGTYGISENAMVEEAKKLLAEAGYPNGKDFPVLTFKYYTHPSIKKLVEAIVQMWKKNLNIDIKIYNAEWKVYYAEVKNGDFEIGQMGWGADYPHPMTFFDVFLSDSPNNLGKWKNAEYDKYVKMAKATTDLNKSLEYMHKAEDVFMKDMVVLTMYHRANYMMMGQHIKGWFRSALGGIYFENAYVE